MVTRLCRTGALCVASWCLLLLVVPPLASPAPALAEALVTTAVRGPDGLPVQDSPSRPSASPPLRTSSGAPEASPRVEADDRLTLQEILADIPRDAAAMVVYGVLLASGALVWWGNRHSGPRAAPPPSPPTVGRTALRRTGRRRPGRASSRTVPTRRPTQRRLRRRAH